MSVSVDIRAGIAVVTLHGPPVNALGRAVREGLLGAVARVAEAGVARAVLTGGTGIFSAGEDLREYDMPPAAPALADVVTAIEGSSVPWVAAISGAALGGGCELALACRARVAAPDAKLGLPAVAFGVVPAATGTQRLPRLIGLGPALELISTGRPVGAGRALEMGLVDEIADDPLARALEIAIPDRPATGGMAAPARDEDAVAAARAGAARKMPGQIAPVVTIDLVSSACRIPFEEAVEAERQAVLDLRSGDQAKALRHLYVAERAACAPERLRAVEAAVPERVAIVGGGTMGAGIACACLDAGLAVTLVERDGEAAARAKGNVDTIVAAGLKRGLIDEAGARERRGRIAFATDLSAARGAGLAIEAVFEAMEVKRAVLAALDAVLPVGVPLATNTSYLDINALSEGLKAPERVLGLHFFAPAHIMKLLEIVAAEATSDHALATGFALAGRLGKVPVLAGVCDGFIGNRILARSRGVADDLVLRGAAPWEIDAAMEAFGYAMGPYAVQDLSGLDIGYANRHRLDATRGDGAPYVTIADRVVEAGRLGRKTGAGWYDYDGGARHPSEAVLAMVEAERAASGRAAESFSPEAISRRLLLSMIDEAAQILADGIAGTAADIDLVTHFGYGFPRWRGGLMHYADSLGPRAVLRDLRALQAEDPALWPPSPMIEAVVAMGTRFSDFQAM